MRAPNLAVEVREKISVAGDTEAVVYAYSCLESGDAARHRRVRAVYAVHAGHIVELRCETAERDHEAARELRESAGDPAFVSLTSVPTAGLLEARSTCGMSEAIEHG